MLFRRSEKSHLRPGTVIVIGALAALGAVSIADKGKRLVKDTWHKMCAIFKKDEE